MVNANRADRMRTNCIAHVSENFSEHQMVPKILNVYKRWWDANLVGGDVGGGALDGLQQVFRPVRWAVPYATPLEDVFLCSSSTPPGGGVHGMCGYHAARAALTSLARRRR